MQDTDNAMKALAGEIFTLTGQKVEITDPIVIAALFQSELLKRHIGNLHDEFKSSVNNTLKDVVNTVEYERKKTEIISKANAAAQQEWQALARAAMRQEIPKMRAEFHEVTTETLLEANGLLHAESKKKWIIGICVAIFVSFIAGCYIGRTLLKIDEKDVPSSITRSEKSIKTD